nr:alpha-amylase family glycosyl hydrolase [Paenibacillus sedimenti]
MSLLQGNTDQAKMAASLLLTLPGNPFIYYGDEIGMKGSGRDENKREPMQWYVTGKGAGQTRWEPAASNRGVTSVEMQTKDANSLFAHYRRMIELRKKEPALKNGDILEFKFSNPEIISFVRATAEEKALILHNVSGRDVEVDLEGGQAGAFSRFSFTSNEEVALNGSKLKLPPYSTVLLK